MMGLDTDFATTKFADAGGMRCLDLKPEIAWDGPKRFAGISQYLKSSYACEPKMDGVRVTLTMGATGNRLSTQRMQVTRNFPHITGAVMPDIDGTVLDGELVAPDPSTGQPLLRIASGLANSNPVRAVRTQKMIGPAKLYLFDVLAIAGGSVMHLTYTQRTELLTHICAAIAAAYPSSQIVQMPVLPATPKTLNRLLEQGYEGAVLKRKTSPYTPGERDGGWYKLKAVSTADAFITGWRPGEGGNTGLVGSFEISIMSRGEPTTVGHVGNFTTRFRKAVTAEDGSLDPVMYGKVVEVTAQALNSTGHLRHPLLKRLRPDKTPADCQADQLEVFTRV